MAHLAVAMTDPGPFDVSTRMDWVASYPKSGNTWVRMLLSAYYGQTALEIGFDIDTGPYFFGAVSPTPIEHLTVGQEIQLRPAALYHLSARHLHIPVIVKTHHMSSVVQSQPLFSPQWTRKVIHVVRDPRDVLPSFAHHTDQDLEAMARQMGEPDALQKDDQNGAHLLGSWSLHAQSWLAEDRFDVLTVRFEDLKDDAGAVLREMLEFLDYTDVDEGKVEKAVEATDFEKLRESEQEHGFPEATSNGRFFRKGESGSWREEVPEALVAKIESAHGEMMERLGYQREAIATV